MKYIIYSLIIILSWIGGIFSQDRVWKENSYIDFIDGTFDDGGANMYVSARGRIQPVNRWDVNDDGYIDLLFANSHPLVEMLDISIYWGNGKDYSIKNHSYIPADGPMWATPGDLNEDGFIDLVVANYSNGTWTEMPSFIYYGGPETGNSGHPAEEWAFYPFNKRIMLPGSNTQKAAIGDFNLDGHKDIVFAFSGGFWEYRDKTKEGFSPSRIYWGDQGNFDAGKFSNLWTVGATDVATADLNDDNWPDLIFANGEGSSSFIYYGSDQGYSETPDFELPTAKAHAVEIADINNDGKADVVFANESGFESYGYLNRNGQFSKSDRIVFETYWAKDIAVSDFNRDGLSDVFFSNHQHSLSGDPRLANRMIDSYLYFGSPDGFNRENRQSVQTIGAWGNAAADLNGDSWTDLLVCNYQEHYSYEVPSFVYWNGPEGFSVTRRTPLYEHGAQGNAIADFNNDGHLDILITSMMGNSRGDYDPNYLYFGNHEGRYSPENRVILPGREAYEQAMADLDDDGAVDILLVNRGETTRMANEAWIYWNKDNKFDMWFMDGLPAYGGIGVEIADLDHNGFLDIIISNSEVVEDKGKSDPYMGSFIYWGTDKGWPISDRTTLPIVMTRSPAVCDINGDSFLDLVFGQQGGMGDASIFLGDGSRKFTEEKRIRIPGSGGTGSPGVADLNKDGRLDIAFAHDKNILIYYQRDDGTFSKDHWTVVPVPAKTMHIADINADGWLDLLCPFYKGDGRRSWYSTVLLGGPDEYDPERSVKLPTDGATGSLVSDFNHDGYPDIFFYCHRADGSYDQIGKFGDHHTNSLIYWGSATGFEETNRLAIPSVGAHYDMGVDLGHIRDRKFTFVYTSSVYETGGLIPAKVSWDAELPHGSSVMLQLRQGRDEADLKQAIWRGPFGENTYYKESGSAISGLSAGNRIQYRVIFDTVNGAAAPVLESVEISFK